MAEQNTARLSADFQICIPEGVRTAKQWKAGQLFAFLPKDGGMLLVPVPELEELAGIARGVTSDDYRDRNDRF